MPVFFLPILVAAAFLDLRFLRIPDKLTLVALIAFAPVAMSLPFDELMFRVTVAATVFAIGFFLFSLRLFGGGDVKFLPVLLLFVPSGDLVLFCYCLSVSIILAILTVEIARRAGARALEDWAILTRRTGLPLGVSFAYAGLLSCVLSSA